MPIQTTGLQLHNGIYSLFIPGDTVTWSPPDARQIIAHRRSNGERVNFPPGSSWVVRQRNDVEDNYNEDGRWVRRARTGTFDFTSDPDIRAHAVFDDFTLLQARNEQDESEQDEQSSSHHRGMHARRESNRLPMYRLLRRLVAYGRRAPDNPELWRNVHSLLTACSSQFRLNNPSWSSSMEQIQNSAVRTQHAALAEWLGQNVGLTPRICGGCHQTVTFEEEQAPARSHDRRTRQVSYHHLCLDCVANGSWVYIPSQRYYVPRQEAARLMERGRIMSYSTDVTQFYDPKLLPWQAKQERDHLLMGVELEVEMPERGVDVHSLVSLVEATLPFSIVKNDSSVRNGFEVVTAPATLDYHLTAWDDFFDVLPPLLRPGDEASSAGMHVHLDRQVISPLTLGKLAELFNAPYNDSPLTKIAGRSLNRAHLATAPEIKKKDVFGDRFDRYNAFSLSRDRTAEVRIFACTTDKPRFLARLEFANAIVYFAADTSHRELGVVEHFLPWLKNNRHRYPNLYRYLKNIYPGQLS